jgi:hypothetical protein
MDLIALDPSSDEAGDFHLNWTGWRVLRELLEELGCDLDEMAGGNDGDVVCDATAKAWAAKITAALSARRIYVVKYPDHMMSGGFREEFHVEDTETPVLISTGAIIEAMFSVATGSASDGDGDCPAENLDRAPDKLIVEEGNEPYEWLVRLAVFFEGAGGFEQW